jgi:hypothetical protein
MTAGSVSPSVVLYPDGGEGSLHPGRRIAAPHRVVYDAAFPPQCGSKKSQKEPVR